MNEADNPANIDSLIADLTCDDVLKCQKARRTLVEMGNPAVAPFIEALSSPIHWVRWEAAKGLGEIGDPSSNRRTGKSHRRPEFRRPLAGCRGIDPYRQRLSSACAKSDHPPSGFDQDEDGCTPCAP